MTATDSVTDPIVDTHVHFFDLANPKLRYEWLDPTNPHPILSAGEIANIAAFGYGMADFLKEARQAGVGKAVHVQAAVGIDDPVQETIWLQSQADTTDFPMAIVGYADLKADDLLDTLERHQLASDQFRGIRDFGDGSEYLTNDKWIEGVVALGERDLVLNVDATFDRMHLVESLSQRASSTVIVLDHMGLPLSRDIDYFENWKRAMSSLATCENVYCKISEVTMIDHGWNASRVRPWLEHCIESFGVSRCMFGTNWPVDRLYVQYPDLISEYRGLVSDLSSAERTSILSGNAEQIYRF